MIRTLIMIVSASLFTVFSLATYDAAQSQEDQSRVIELVRHPATYATPTMPLW